MGRESVQTVHHVHFMKGYKCRPGMSSMLKNLNGIYKRHRNKDAYPQYMVDAMELRRRKYREDGRKKKEKEKKNNDNNKE